MNLSVIQNIIQEFGTPLYVYDATRIKIQYDKLKNAFRHIDHKIHYASKANENINILEIMRDLGAGIDAVSPNEVKQALKTGFDKNDIVFTPSCAGFNEISFALDNDIRLHVGALEYIPFILENYPDRAVGLRINPGNSIGGNQKIATAHQNSKFGIPYIHLKQILSYVDKGLKIDSLHIHTGSDVKSWKDLARSVDSVFSFAKHFNNLKYIDLGSGFKVKYKAEDSEIDLESYAKHIEQKLKDFPYAVSIKFEPGKFLVSEAGILLTKANIIKKGFHKTFVGVNSGFHHLIRPMYYDAYHEIVNISNPDGEIQTYDVVGQLCEEDTFAYDRTLNEVRVGDILMIKNTGAYGYSLSSEYNLRDKPKEIVIGTI